MVVLFEPVFMHGVIIAYFSFVSCISFVSFLGRGRRRPNEANEANEAICNNSRLPLQYKHEQTPDFLHHNTCCTARQHIRLAQSYHWPYCRIGVFIALWFSDGAGYCSTVVQAQKTILWTAFFVVIYFTGRRCNLFLLSIKPLGHFSVNYFASHIFIDYHA